MRRLRPVLVVVVMAGLLFVLMAIQNARDRSHQQPLGFKTMGTQRL